MKSISKIQYMRADCASPSSESCNGTMISTKVSQQTPLPSSHKELQENSSYKVQYKNNSLKKKDSRVHFLIFPRRVRANDRTRGLCPPSPSLSNLTHHECKHAYGARKGTGLFITSTNQETTVHAIRAYTP